MRPDREIPTEQEARQMLKAEELQRQLESMSRENAALRSQRDIARADLKLYAPRGTPEEEAEALRLLESSIPNGLADLIRKLESEGDSGGRQRA